MIEDEKSKLYVLVYKKDGDDRPYFFLKNQNLYLGKADLTQHIDKAHKLSIKEAEDVIDKVVDRERWELWTIKQGWVLDEKSDRLDLLHRRTKLLKEIEEIDRQLMEDSALRVYK